MHSVSWFIVKLMFTHKHAMIYIIQMIYEVEPANFFTLICPYLECWFYFTFKENVYVAQSNVMMCTVHVCSKLLSNSTMLHLMLYMAVILVRNDQLHLVHSNVIMLFDHRNLVAYKHNTVLCCVCYFLTIRCSFFTSNCKLNKHILFGNKQ